VTLKELSSGKAVGRPQDRAGASLNMRQQPGSDGFEIAREIELGDRFAVAGVGP
jgi:hypothetical protein